MIPVIAIFDIGKTNKKLFLFDDRYRVVYEQSTRLPEIIDEDGFPCEDLEGLIQWVQQAFQEVLELKSFSIQALQFATYGASLVYVDSDGNPLTPLYNYLKPYPSELADELYRLNGGEELFSLSTCSPALGSLNSGLQLYRLFRQRSEQFQQVRCALHLPQFISYLFSRKMVSEITSIGCHTALWNFQQFDYHSWIYSHGLNKVLPERVACDAVESISINDQQVAVGVGLHDSSAALIPYLSGFTEPFVLISTGTWCISLHPFNEQPLTASELKNDCLCYYSFKGKPVKASRLFAGYLHEQEVLKLARKFQQPGDFYKEVKPDDQMIRALIDTDQVDEDEWMSESQSDYAGAYHVLMAKIIKDQLRSTQLVLRGTTVKRIFVDGGFASNPVYMNFLAAVLPGYEVYAASMMHATALGAALSIHHQWNTQPITADLIALQLYANRQNAFNF